MFSVKRSYKTSGSRKLFLDTALLAVLALDSSGRKAIPWLMEADLLILLELIERTRVRFCSKISLDLYAVGAFLDITFSVAFCDFKLVIEMERFFSAAESNCIPLEMDSLSARPSGSMAGRIVTNVAFASKSETVKLGRRGLDVLRMADSSVADRFKACSSVDFTEDVIEFFLDSTTLIYWTD